MNLPASLPISPAPFPDFVRMDTGAAALPPALAVSEAINDTAFVEVAAGPAMLIVGKSGRIREANAAAESLFGYRGGGLCGLRVSLLMPTLTDVALSDGREFSHLKFLSHCGVGFSAHRSNGDDFACALSFVELHDAAESLVRMIVTGCKPA